MSNLKESLIRLGAQRPDLRKDIRPILAALGGIRGRQRKVAIREKEIEQVMKREVAESIEKVEGMYDGWGTEYLAKAGRGFKFGSGSDIAAGAETQNGLGYLTSTGRFPRNSKLGQPLHKAEEASYEFAKKGWMRVNRDFIQANNLSADQITYHELYELGFVNEAEDLSEHEMQAQQGEDIVFRLGAFYFSPENSLNRTGDHKMEVFALADLYGHFLPRRPIHTFSDAFTFSDLRDLRGKLNKALKRAVKSLA